MILDHISNVNRYLAMHPGFRKAFNFLESPNLAALPDGRHDIDSEHCFAVISRGPGRGRQGAKLEAHRRYIDIQFAIDGSDEIGWKPTPQCSQVEIPFNAKKDAALFADPPDAWVSLPPRTFAIFFPEDAHAPLAGQGHLHKTVVKIMEEPF